jgi:peptide/nickel transport system permease protein
VARYIVIRLLQALLTLLIIATLAFALTRLVPGNPARIALGGQASAASVAELEHKLGLDQPVLTQYFHYLGNVVRLEFGESTHEHEAVTTVVGRALEPSFWLVVYSLILAVIAVVPLAMIAAVRRNRPADHLIRLGSTLGYATPAFLSGLILILVFSLELGWFPVEGYGSGASGHLQSLTLPAVTVALAFAPLILRTLRAGLIDALGREFVEASRGRGLSRWRVLFRHVLRNGMLPALTILGLSVGAILSWAVVVENVFSLPGLGSLLISSVGYRDYPVIQALVLIFGGCVVLVSLATDLLYLRVDPRVRLGSAA